MDADNRFTPEPVTATHRITYPHTDQGDDTPVHLVGTGYATRCAACIVHENVPDALWALEVLNKYGHLVTHPADRLSGEAHQPKLDPSAEHRERMAECG